MLGCSRTGLVFPEADGGAAAGCATAVPRAQADVELMRRWNVAVTATNPHALDFTWRSVDDFPHATFRGGTAAAYAEFADVLLAFWRDSGTLQFVSCNALFEASYKSGPAAATQKFVQLRPLTLELSMFSLVDATRRAQLTQLCSTIGC